MSRKVRKSKWMCSFILGMIWVNIANSSWQRLTLMPEAISPMGLKLWFWCVSKSLHTTHTGSLSSRQYSSSFRLCWLQSSARLFSSWTKDSHRFFRIRLRRGGFDKHSFVPLTSQNLVKQSLHTLCEHVKITGFVKMCWHTGQLKSSARNGRLNAILCNVI